MDKFIGIGVVVIILLGAIAVTAALYRSVAYDDIPSNLHLEYRAVESTGYYGSAEYYLFDSVGNRYRVKQEVFDSYTNLPRK